MTIKNCARARDFVEVWTRCETSLAGSRGPLPLVITELIHHGAGYEGGPPFCREPNRTIIAHRKVAPEPEECVTHAFSCDTYIVTSHPVQTL